MEISDRRAWQRVRLYLSTPRITQACDNNVLVLRLLLLDKFRQRFKTYVHWRERVGVALITHLKQNKNVTRYFYTKNNIFRTSIR